MLSPLLVRQGIIYLPKEHYCHIRSTDIFGTAWMTLICYLVPFSCVLIIYIRIIVFLRRQSSNIAVTVQRRQQRDLMVIRRVLINVAILLVGGMPGSVLISMTLFSGVEQPLQKRIPLMSVGITAVVLSVEMVFMTPQLKRLILSRWQQNRVTPNHCMIQIKPIVNSQ